MSNFLNIIIRRSITSIRLSSTKLFSSQSLSDVCKDFLKPLSINKLPQFKSNFCTAAYEINTNLAKDVILFQYENARFYKIINIFALCQFLFWNYLSHFSFTKLKDAPVTVSENDSWYRKINLGDNKFRYSITIFCFLLGYGILAATWMFTLRSVRFLILRKGGRDVTIVTYGPMNKNRLMTVPLNCMSAQESRQAAKVQLPIKVKNKSLYYVLDMRGEFKNTQLFDYTAGLKRKI